LLSCLEEEFGCMCGANTYLTPYPKEKGATAGGGAGRRGGSGKKKAGGSGSGGKTDGGSDSARAQGQGFSPHYDDIEAFVMQV
jgi:hypothetical protein